MEENNNTQTEAFIRKALKQIPRESPSKSFTSDVIHVLEKEKSIQYSSGPLISKKVGLGLLALILSFVFIPWQKNEGGILEGFKLDFSFFESLNLTGLIDASSISSIALYGSLFFVIMIGIQVVFIKNHIIKRMETGL